MASSVTGAKKETAAQRRQRQNQGFKASNNPFKTADAKAPKKPTPSFGKLPKAGTVKAAEADVASNNIDKLLKWIQKRVNQYHAVNVTNFTTSWEDGKALCALMNYLLGDEALKTEDVSPDDKDKNLAMAIKCATDNGVPELIQASEVGLDRRSMITYLHMVYTKLHVDKKEKEEKDKEGETGEEGEKKEEEVKDEE